MNNTLPAPLVLLHGALNDASVWEPVRQRLQGPVLVPDLPGRGSPALPSIEALADWLWQDLDARGIERAVLAGHSMGSLIALEAAAHKPERVAGLVLVATAFPMKVSPALLEQARTDAQGAMQLIDQYSRSHDDGGRLMAMMRRLEAANPGLLAHELALCDSYAGGMTAAAGLRCPVWAVLGELDKMTPPKRSRELLEKLHAHVATGTAGHSLMAEAADLVFNTLKTAIQETRP
ncbi:alpha/beta fold hydrolase [Burkholderiaceae bacterium UC74_6]